MKTFKCPHCERHQNVIGFVFDWNKEGRRRFRMHLKVFHPRKNVKKTLRYVKKHLASN